MTMYRQGDVLLERVSSATLGREIGRESGRIVLAHGEESGHTHAIHEPQAALFHGRRAGPERFLRVCSPATLVHEEHAEIPLPEGLYRVRRQRVWSDDDEPVAAQD
jgi:hypothetical protein